MICFILLIFSKFLFFLCFILLCHSFSDMLSLRKIPNNKLFVSEPNPNWFGNSANEINNNLWTNKNWLKSRFHFSFAEYNNHHNSQFGILRVLNDDLVQPNRGFGEHPHRDVEICTYIVEGSLSHQDSTGTEETLSRGAVQFMTAGSGIYHSEHNRDTKLPLRFLQLWITTRKRGLSPNYGSYIGNSLARTNQWEHIVSDIESKFKTPIKINQDANIFVTEVDPNGTKEVEITIDKSRQAYLVCVEGSIKITGEYGEETLSRHDAAELFGPNKFKIVSTSPSSSANESIESKSQHTSGAHLLMVEMKFVGSGRLDL